MREYNKGLYLNIKGQLMNLTDPKVMGILNVTPDSFYPGSRTNEGKEIFKRINEIISEGADIIDVGGCSTRPGFKAPSLEEEWKRIDLGCRVIRENKVEIPISVDTFRAEIARRAIEHWDVDIINDVSGGNDPDMWSLISEKKIAYILTHNKKTQENTAYITAEVVTELSRGLNELHRLGINDVIIDPGFGFFKDVKENFLLLDRLEEITKMGYPVLVGISRKSMIWKTLESTAENSLTGTIVLNSWALLKGATILRVHDVKETVDTVKLFKAMKGGENI